MMSRSTATIVLAVSASVGCGGDDRTGSDVHASDLEFPNARWIEGNASPIEANGSPIEANGSPIEANDRRIDGVTSRSVGINDHLANTFAAPEGAVDAAARQGWYLPEMTDLVIEGYPAAFTGFDRCLALDPGAITSEWRVAPSTPVTRDGRRYVESGFIELYDGVAWTAAAVDTTLYLPATAAPALTVMLDPAAVPDAARRPALFRMRVAGSLPVRDPTDLAAPTVDRGAGRMYRKQLVIAELCLPDPADAAVASWIPIGAVTFGDAYGFDVALSPASANRPDGDGIRALAPWLRFKGYIGRDPGDTSAKAEMYYTGGLVTRGDPALEPRLVCGPPGGVDAETAATSLPDPPVEEMVPIAELNARIAVVFANAMDVPVAGPTGGTAMAGMTVNGTPIRVSLVTPPGCEVVVPAALAPFGFDARVDWSPSEEELAAPERLDSLCGRPTTIESSDVFRSRNSTACGLDDQRVDGWVEAAPGDDGIDVPTRRHLAALRATWCDAVALGVTPAPAQHHGRYRRWDDKTGGLTATRVVGYWLTASPIGVLARCGDKIYDREFERGTCEHDHPIDPPPPAGGDAAPSPDAAIEGPGGDAMGPGDAMIDDADAGIPPGLDAMIEGPDADAGTPPGLDAPIEGPGGDAGLGLDAME
jgi:hypothetical protein